MGGGGIIGGKNFFRANFVFLRLWRQHPFLQKTKGSTRNPFSPTSPPPLLRRTSMSPPPPLQSNFQVALQIGGGGCMRQAQTHIEGGVLAGLRRLPPQRSESPPSQNGPHGDQCCRLDLSSLPGHLRGCAYSGPWRPTRGQGPFPRL